MIMMMITVVTVYHVMYNYVSHHPATKVNCQLPEGCGNHRVG